MKDRILKTIVPISLIVLLIILAAVYAFIPSFVMRVALHTYLRLLNTVFSVYVLNKVFCRWLTNSKKIVLSISAVAIGIDLVVVDTVRFVLNDGIGSVLFLSACMPICCMAYLYYLFKENNYKARAKVILFVVGIPLLLLSLYFEVLSFIDM